MIIGRRSASADVSSEDVSMTELTKRRVALDNRGITRKPPSLFVKTRYSDELIQVKNLPTVTSPN
jgi:hypothetical protein